ncbi:MAG: hypothetical protein ACE15C_17710 [Phycisphaerae bacterium]
MGKHVIAMLGLLAVVGIAATAAVAADEQPAKDPAVSRPGLGALANLPSLTDEQKARIKEIMEAARADAEKADGREAKVKAMRDAMDKIVKDVLTDDQRKAVEDLKAKFAGAGDMMAKFRLTDEQKAKAKEIIEAAKADAAKAEGPEAKMKVFKDAFDKLVKDVLTEEQQKALEELKSKLAINIDEIKTQLEKVKLTDDQKAKVKDIMDAARADAQKAEGAEARIKVFKDAFEKVKSDVLTEDQRKAVGELRTMFDTVRERLMLMITRDAAPKAEAPPAPSK